MVSKSKKPEEISNQLFANFNDQVFYQTRNNVYNQKLDIEYKYKNESVDDITQTVNYMD